jgi:hypothetical protein
MRRLYVVTIIIVAHALAVASLGGAAAKDRNGPDVTQKPSSNQPLPVPYPNSNCPQCPTPTGPTPHGPRSEPQYPLPLPGR